MREALSARKNWQKYANVGGSGREDTVNAVLQTYLLTDGNYEVTLKPRELSHIYGAWGIIPELGIRYTPTNRIAFVEAKRQGDQGNAHERLCKYFAPGLLPIASGIAGFSNPFFFVLMNGLVSDPKKRTEIAAWFDADGFRDRFLLWDRKFQSLIDWFNSTIRRYLD